MAGTTGSPIDALPRSAESPGHEEAARTAAERFVQAIADRDPEAILTALAPEARLRYLIPSGPDEIDGAARVTARFLGWFDDAEVLQVRSVHVEPLADRTSAGHRFLLRGKDGWEVVEQQMYLDVDDQGRITAIDLLCSGFRPGPDPEPGRSTSTHGFDAGTLSCADGLAQEFRRRILAVPLGDLLVVQTSDPAAKEDLPPLARMMGHTVRSIEPSGNGRLLITVERGR